jgi:elongation factor Ts
MTAISASMVKELREKTGAGMMDCKKALQSSEGDLDAAIKFLREKGLAAASKKAGRIAAEGLVGICVAEGEAAMIEVNCETDFVAKNSDFQNFVVDMAHHVVEANPGKVKTEDSGAGEALYEQAFTKDQSKKVVDVLNDKISTIGENIALRRFERFTKGNTYGSYLHGGGTIGVLTQLNTSDPEKGTSETLKILARDLAMHIASENPLAIDRNGVDPALIESEREIFRKQALDQGKPEKIVDKIVDGRINKFLQESCLIEQGFIKDPDTTIKKLLAKLGAELGTDITVTQFTRYKVGEGIEKKSDNLAEEVAKMTA